MLRIVADSSCDLAAELLDRHRIQTVPLTVDIDGEHFREGVDIMPREFYAKMARSSRLPTTAQPSPAIFAEKFQALAADGPVLCVTISSKLSGTFQSATLGAELSGVDVTVFDDRPALASRQFFPAPARLEADTWEKLLALPLPAVPSFGLIVTRGHRHDALVRFASQAA